jgi:CheY-like chemotaxis protein
MSQERTRPPVRIVVVEDNPADVYLLQRALQRAQLTFTLDHLSDGEEAVDFFYQQGKYRDAQRPDLIVLDITLPKLTGDEVLQKLRECPDLRRVPVIVWTTSRLLYDHRHMTALQVDGYVTKSSDLATAMAIGPLIKELLAAREPRA